MALSSISCLGLLLVTTLLGLLQLPVASTEYPGVIELVGYSNRRARTHYMPVESGHQLDSPTQAPSPGKTQADIETVKQNIEKYNKLLTLDTKNLPESQKDMLERIVERVARLKESLDIEENAETHLYATKGSEDTTSASNEDSATTEIPTPVEAETDPTLVLDETTLLQLQTSMDELAAAQASATAQTIRTQEDFVPSTTEVNLETDASTDESAVDTATSVDSLAQTGTADADTDYGGSTTIDSLLTDATDADDQFVAARSNNNIAAITAADPDPSSTLSTNAGNQRTLTTSGKLQKTRATKRPSSASSAATTLSKRGQRPGSASTAGLHKQTTTKQKLAATITTTQPLQYQKQHLKPQQQQHYQQQQHKVSPLTDTKIPVTLTTTPTVHMHQRTPQTAGTPSGSTASTYSSNTNSYPNAAAAAAAANDMVYDAHVNTSAIIDSLNNAREEFYQQKQTVNNKDKKPSATAKPTKYHYYPHNQHIYLLPECAIQQVCNAVYVRLNYTQPLCACPSRYRDPCSASLNEDDQHTTKLVGDGKKKAITLAKTCEATTEMRECRSPKDWSLLALQNTRTGKSHYLVICRCPDHFKMEGPMAHDQPTYASVPGIRVFGMMCVKPGYSVRKPSAQPPKRYQLTKPFYRPNTQQSSFGSNSNSGGSVGGGSQYGSNKDNYGRPAYGASSSSSSNNYHPQDSFANQQQSTYQYLNRPEGAQHSSQLGNSNYRPESINSFGQGGGAIYGRNNERKGEAPIEAAATTQEEETASGKILIATSTQPTEETKTTLNSDESSSADSGAIILSAPGASSAQSEEEGKQQREKRSVAEDVVEFDSDADMPEFPWDRVLEFQQSIIWD